MKNLIPKLTAMIFCLLLCGVTLIPNAHAQSFSVGFTYSNSIWSPNTIGFGYMPYWGYGSYVSYGNYFSTYPAVPRIVTPVRFPAPSAAQYQRDYVACLRHLDQKYAVYLRAQNQQASLRVPSTEQDRTLPPEPDKKLELKEIQEIPSLYPDEFDDQPQPKEIEILEQGTVVMASY
ncbi:MAG: hypothetical protein ACD_62C00202G0001 [uncultured bacterium]|nr:MAG: hypothetical protein ACD_62C00202G0001 [uncultured bacterium]